MLSEEELSEMDREVREILDEARAFAEASPVPAPDDLYTHTYAQENAHGRLFLDGRDR